MIYITNGNIAKSRWEDFSSLSEDKKRYPNVTVYMAEKEDFIVCQDGWWDIYTPIFTTENIARLLSLLLDDDIQIKQLGTCIAI